MGYEGDNESLFCLENNLNDTSIVFLDRLNRIRYVFAVCIYSTICSAKINELAQDIVMATNNKTTSDKVATLASQVLNDASSSVTARSLAASALSQAKAGKQTGAEMESFASMVLQSSKYSEDTKTLAASILAQANKER